MMNRMKNKAMKKAIVVGALAAVAFPSSVNAQVTTGQVNDFLSNLNTITTAVPFLLITPDSRAGGMGETGVASTPDVNSIHWNAAKLAFAPKKMGLGISYTPWLRALVPDINLAYVSFYSKPNKNSAFAGSMRYFSMGNITFTDVSGNTIGQFKPNEFAFDFAYSRKLSDRFSAGMTARLVRSNLTNGITVQGQDTRPGSAVAVDLSGYYHNDEMKISGKPTTFMAGMAITNIGNKISYSTSINKDFIPINLRLGSGISVKADDYNRIGFQLEFNKLLVPTPPVYEIDPLTGSPKVVNGQFVILAGKDPNRSVPEGMFGSFNDAPGGFREELKEINISTGLEYWYNETFAVRMGYFYEAPTKGNRQFFTLGAGIKYNVFGLDFAYLIPTNAQRSPLQNTLRFSLTFDFDAFKSQNSDSDAK